MQPYNQRMPPKSNVPPKSHAERGRPPPPQMTQQQDRALSRMNYDMRGGEDRYIKNDGFLKGTKKNNKKK